MFNIGGGEVLVILVVALIFLGPSKLPEIARTLGKTTQTIRRVSDSFRSELTAAVDDDTETKARQRGNEITGSKTPSNEVGTSSNESGFALGDEGQPQDNENTQ
ncbi:MAG: Sec-independent protein translocase protein TatB [Actinomycetota bacterium]|nr:Sec-independent protein translocase protein TatB [Actinomycetota bacterium]MEC8985553.1 Sec-independent protein translocase protein TatB [Actinomycetota bacterium]MED5229525.1 Sec-independent protein translocase protein TatB [Actinomycetota bacterium]